jgi:hypothetical protein
VRKHDLLLIHWKDVTQKLGPLPVKLREFITLGFKEPNSQEGLTIVYNYDLDKGPTSEKTGSFCFPRGLIKPKDIMVVGSLIVDNGRYEVVTPEGQALYTVERIEE